MSPLNDIVPPGVVTGDNLLKLLTHARENGYAIPAFNCTRYETTMSENVWPLAFSHQKDLLNLGISIMY